MNGWSEFTDDEYTTIWDRFYAEFDFKPNYHERSKSAISEPLPFVTYDLSANLSVQAISEIDGLLFDSFKAITPIGQLIYWLDWHHKCYRFDPQCAVGFGPTSWYPDGDYYIFLASDFSWGTFGHPWQQSLCVFGVSLLNRVDQYMRDRLMVLRESPPNEFRG